MKYSNSLYMPSVFFLTWSSLTRHNWLWLIIDIERTVRFRTNLYVLKHEFHGKRYQSHKNKIYYFAIKMFSLPSNHIEACLPGADPGFQKGGGIVVSGTFLANLVDFSKNFGLLRPPPPLWIRACVAKNTLSTCRILISFSLGGSYPRLLWREKLWTTASFPYLWDGRTQLQPMRYWYFSRTSDVTLGDYGRAVGPSLWVKQDVPCAEVVLCCCQMSNE